jgi:hypothetical protein
VTPTDTLVRDFLSIHGYRFQHHRCDPPILGADGSTHTDVVVVRRPDGSVYIVRADVHGTIGTGPDLATYPGR